MIFGSDQRSCAGGSPGARFARSLALRTIRGREGLKESLLDDIRGPVWRTKSQQCISVQTITVPVDPTLGVDLLCVVHGPHVRRWSDAS